MQRSGDKSDIAMCFVFDVTGPSDGLYFLTQEKKESVNKFPRKVTINVIWNRLNISQAFSRGDILCPKNFASYINKFQKSFRCPKWCLVRATMYTVESPVRKETR